MLAAIVELDVKTSAVDAVKETLRKLAAETQKEKNNHFYSINQSTEKHNVFVIYEIYKSVTDWETHLHSEHVQQALQHFDFILLTPPRINLCHVMT